MIFLWLIFPISCFWSSTTATIIGGAIIVRAVIVIRGTTVIVGYRHGR